LLQLIQHRDKSGKVVLRLVAGRERFEEFADEPQLLGRDSQPMLLARLGFGNSASTLLDLAQALVEIATDRLHDRLIEIGSVAAQPAAALDPACEIDEQEAGAIRAQRGQELCAGVIAP